MPVNKLGISHEKFVRETKRHHILAFRSLYMQSVSKALKKYEQLPTEDRLVDLYHKAMIWKKSRPREISGVRNNHNIITELFSAIEKQITCIKLQNTFSNAQFIANDVVKNYLYYRKIYIVNDADTRDENKEKLKASGSSLLAAAIHGHRDQIAQGENGIMARMRAINKNTCEYWEQKGKQVAEKADSYMRCAECSALIVHWITVFTRARMDADE